jgi:hypothetical protein
MGNPLHMEIAQRSVREWNRWRGKIFACNQI